VRLVAAELASAAHHETLSSAYRQRGNSALPCRLWVIGGQTIPG